MKLSAILHLPRMDTLLRKSSYIFLLRMVLPWGQNRWYWSYFQYLCDFSSMYGFIEKEMQAHCRMWQSVKCECVLCELAAHAEVLVYVNEYFVSILCQYYVSILCVNTMCQSMCQNYFSLLHPVWSLRIPTWSLQWNCLYATSFGMLSFSLASMHASFKTLHLTLGFVYMRLRHFSKFLYKFVSHFISR